MRLEIILVLLALTLATQTKCMSSSYTKDFSMCPCLKLHAAVKAKTTLKTQGNAGAKPEEPTPRPEEAEEPTPTPEEIWTQLKGNSGAKPEEPTPREATPEEEDLWTQLKGNSGTRADAAI